MKFIQKKTMRETVKILVTVIIFIVIVNILILFLQLVIPSTKIDKDYIYHLSNTVKNSMIDTLPDVFTNYTNNELVFNYKSSSYKKYLSQTLEHMKEEGSFTFKVINSEIFFRVNWSTDILGSIVIREVSQVENKKSKIIYEL